MADARRRAGGENAAWLAALGGAALAGVLLALALWGALGAGSEPDPDASRPGVAAGSPPDTRPDGATRAPAAAGTAADAADAGATTTAPTAAEAPSAIGFQPSAGSCVAVVAGEDGANTVATVDCAASHLFEVVATVDVSEQFATRPTDQEWTALLTMRCPDLLRAYIGPAYDPHGRFVLRVSAPTAAEWAAGDRIGECLVSVGTDATGRPVAFEGPVRGAPQAVALRAGDCVDLAPIDGIPPAVVGCDEAHELEVLSALDLTGAFEHYPTTAEWEQAAARCLPALTERFGAEPTATGGNALTPVVVPIPIESWLVGRRATGCAVGELDDRGDLVERTTALGG